MTESSKTSLYAPFETHHRVVYQDPREEGTSADQYARGLAAYMHRKHPQMKIAIVESSTRENIALQDVHQQLAALNNRWNLPQDAADELPALVGHAGEGAGVASTPQLLAQQLDLAQAYAQHTDILIVVNPLTAADNQIQSAAFTQLEKRVKKHPMLAEKSKIFIVSETEEVARRIQRDRTAE